MNSIVACFNDYFDLTRDYTKIYSKKEFVQKLVELAETSPDSEVAKLFNSLYHEYGDNTIEYAHTKYDNSGRL